MPRMLLLCVASLPVQQGRGAVVFKNVRSTNPPFSSFGNKELAAVEVEVEGARRRAVPKWG